MTDAFGMRRDQGLARTERAGTSTTAGVRDVRRGGVTRRRHRVITPGFVWNPADVAVAAGESLDGDRWQPMFER